MIHMTRSDSVLITPHVWIMASFAQPAKYCSGNPYTWGVLIGPKVEEEKAVWR
jgi:hypothetical protein